jgi:DNA-binding transcriptional MerR regulator
VGKYSIKEIERITGIKAHTIRIWEQRFQFIEPHRTETNIRFYDDEHLKTLLNISVLIKNGQRISQISKLSTPEIRNELERVAHQTSTEGDFFAVQVDALVVAMLDLDEFHFDKIIGSGAVRYGFENVMIRLIIPFLQKVGILWSTGEINVAQEHFITNLIRRKLIVAIDANIGKITKKERFILFLPDGELHEIGLLFAKYLIRMRGFPILYLGQSVPLPDLIAVAKEYKPDHFLTYFTLGQGLTKTQTYIQKMQTEFPNSSLCICGPLAPEIKNNLHPGALHLSSIESLTELLETLS